jgi:serine/threonine-protein phosphatase 2A regulatory subunit B''
MSTRSSYDTVGDGYLREYDLENYVFELIPTLPNLRQLKDNFIPFYVFTAVRKFLVFLDPKKTGASLVPWRLHTRACSRLHAPLTCTRADPFAGRIPINEVVGSKAMSELLALRSEHPGVDAPAPPAPPSTNWFSAANALRVYSQYLELDVDMNGMLSKEELMAYGASLPVVLKGCATQ